MEWPWSRVASKSNMTVSFWLHENRDTHGGCHVTMEAEVGVTRLPVARGKQSAFSFGDMEIWVRSLGWEDTPPPPPPQRRKWQPTPGFLPVKSNGQRILMGCDPWGCKEGDTTERLNNNKPNCQWLPPNHQKPGEKQARFLTCRFQQ